MSKLFKELNYDTDRVMQPGDPITSPDGKTKVVANNDGTATLVSGGALPENATFADLQASLGLSDTATLGDAETALGLNDNSQLEDARQAGGVTTKTIATETYVDTVVGDIDSVLDGINGEVV